MRLCKNHPSCNTPLGDSSLAPKNRAPWLLACGAGLVGLALGYLGGWAVSEPAPVPIPMDAATPMPQERCAVPSDCRMVLIDERGTSHWECPNAFIGEMAEN